MTGLSRTAGSKIPGPQVGFTDLIDHCLNEEDSSLDTFPLRPSSAGRCSRAMAFELYQYMGRGSFKGEQKDPATKRLLSLGSSVEWHVIRNFDLISKANKDFKITYKQQVLLAFQLDPANKADKNPPLIKGSLDFAVENRKEGWSIFFDCKSAKDKFSSFHATKWDETLEKLSDMESVDKVSDTSFWVEDLGEFIKELNDPFFEDNFEQLNIYCCTDFAKAINCIAGSIIKYNKNDSRMFEVRFKPCQKVAKRFQDKCNKVYKLVMNGTEKDLRGMQCDFPLGSIKKAFCACGHYAGEDKEADLKAYFRTFPAKKWPTDIGKLKGKKHISAWFNDYLLAQGHASEVDRIEKEIVEMLAAENCQKIRLENGHVYEVKFLKTGGAGGGPRTVLRRSKA